MAVEIQKYNRPAPKQDEDNSFLTKIAKPVELAKAGASIYSSLKSSGGTKDEKVGTEGAAVKTDAPNTNAPSPTDNPDSNTEIVAKAQPDQSEWMKRRYDQKYNKGTIS